MDSSNKNKQISKTLQILLWLWFGTITSFVSVNVVNIAILQTELNIIKRNLTNHENRILILNNKIK